MSRTDQDTIELRCDDKRTINPCVVEPPSPARAMKKALRVLGWTWLGAIISFVIPLIHWVTVPAGLFMGPILARLIYKNNLHRATIDCPSAECPACGAKIPVRFGSDVRELERTCKHCKAAVTVALITASSAAAPK